MLHNENHFAGGQTLFVSSGRVQKMHLTVVQQQLPTDETHVMPVFTVLKENYSMTRKVIRAEVGISAASVFSILTKHLGERKVYEM
jgi:hypothetical protein